jgi:hypothetical protein
LRRRGVLRANRASGQAAYNSQRRQLDAKHMFLRFGDFTAIVVCPPVADGN